MAEVCICFECRFTSVFTIVHDGFIKEQEYYHLISAMDVAGLFLQWYINVDMKRNCDNSLTAHSSN